MSRTGRMSVQCTAVIALAIGLAACGSKTASSPTTSSSSSTTMPPSTTTASSGPASGATGVTTVTIHNFKFSPDNPTVKVGATITVHNEDSTTHTFTADNKAFDTGDIPAGGTKTVTVSKAGSYPFMCTIHPFMTGTLTVSG